MFFWTNVTIFNQTVWHLLIFKNCGNLDKVSFLKRKVFNSFIMCQAQFNHVNKSYMVIENYKLIENVLYSDFIWPDNDNHSQLPIRNSTHLSSLNLDVIVWFWNLEASSCWMIKYDLHVHSVSSYHIKFLLEKLRVWVFISVR